MIISIARNEPYIVTAPERSLPPGAGLFIGVAISLGLWVVIAGIVLIV